MEFGDTIRVSLTEDPEFEIPVCKDLVKRYEVRSQKSEKSKVEVPELDIGHSNFNLPYSPFSYSRRKTFSVSNIGDHHVPVVVADFMKAKQSPKKICSRLVINMTNEHDKWNIGDAAADYIFTGNKIVDFEFPGTLKVICDNETWLNANDKEKYFPLFNE